MSHNTLGTCNDGLGRLWTKILVFKMCRTYNKTQQEPNQPTHHSEGHGCLLSWQQYSLSWMISQRISLHTSSGLSSQNWLIYKNVNLIFELSLSYFIFLILRDFLILWFCIAQRNTHNIIKNRFHLIINWSNKLISCKHNP